jgi:REP element-mobilizing transposase RayT
MPKKNILKKYCNDSYYHIYNRGINKGKIFFDAVDYDVFLKYLAESLSFKDSEMLRLKINSIFLNQKVKKRLEKELFSKNFYKEVQLISYCLMPNHFHFLIKQNSKMSMPLFMQSIMTRYVMYFNKKYGRVGPLFESKYKAVLMQDSQQLLYVSKYIHLNPVTSVQVRDPVSQRIITQPSSYLSFIKLNKIKWLHPEIIIDNNKKSVRASYKKFVEEGGSDPVK